MKASATETPHENAVQRARILLGEANGKEGKAATMLHALAMRDATLHEELLALGVRAAMAEARTQNNRAAIRSVNRSDTGNSYHAPSCNRLGQVISIYALRLENGKSLGDAVYDDLIAQANLHRAYAGANHAKHKWFDAMARKMEGKRHTKVCEALSEDAIKALKVKAGVRD